MELASVHFHHLLDRVQSALRGQCLRILPLDQESAFFCSLAGYREPFDNDRIKSLYPTEKDYLDRVAAMVDRIVNERFLTESDGERIKKEAEGVEAWKDNSGL